MRFFELMLKYALLIAVLFCGRGALAAPVTCSYGYQDSTCGSSLSNAPQVAPTCPGTAGWTTTVSARWIGSQYSPPQCSYQASPTCPTGFTQTSGPSWTGSSWVGLGCAPDAVVVTPADQQQACLTYGLAHDFYPIGPWAFGYQYNGPYDGTGASAYSPSVPLLAFTDPSSGEAIWSGKGSFSPPVSAPTQMVVVSGAAVDVCWFVPGTTNLIGQYNLEGVSSGGNGG